MRFLWWVRRAGVHWLRALGAIGWPSPYPTGLLDATRLRFILNHMVKQEADLDRVFHALASEPRRRILAQLSGQPRSVTEIADGFDISLPAVSKHLRVLEGAGLVTRSREGRVHHIQLRAAPMADAAGWLDRYHEFWSERFERLADLVEEDPDPPKPST